MSGDQYEVPATGPEWLGQLSGTGVADPIDPIRVVYADDNTEFATMAESTLDAEGPFEVITVESAEAAIEHLDAADCIVSNLDGSARTDDDLLSAVRERDPTLPFVLFTVRSLRDVSERTLDGFWTDYLEKDGLRSLELLGKRIRRLVAHRDTRATARRSLAAAEATQEGVVIVDPDGTVRFANHVYAMRLGYDPGEIEGRPWQDCYTDDEADRLASTVLPTVEDDWRWTGECVARRWDGSTVAVQASIVRLDDDSLVIVHDGDADAA
ncbi:hypothetical protein BV210_09375 [Halorientalis sp. IM1011]|uniref:PAS domain-containing protein n=1 Tax=Halorientalis sp. IM1011 TaxID=1932360 RepID=UPI00097CC956|nr:PAS domain-containing protein [Halorientalis sp. IM1011]AQL42912.1 hypothetical protein BV210_09375 [Halorientalis sp. IM1011]